MTDAIGRTWQAGTYQLDYVLPERLDATYIDETGAKARPVMLHRAVFGTFERFIGLLDRTLRGQAALLAGACTQVVVAAITSEVEGLCAAKPPQSVDASGACSADLDIRNEKINYKVREHSHAKVPVIAVVGAREAEEQTVSLRRLGEKAQEVAARADALAALRQNATAPDLRGKV